MSNISEKLSGNDAAHTDSLIRGGIGFFGGLLLCGAALMVQAAVLQAVSGNSKKAI